MRRREFIGLSSSTMVAWPLAARAQLLKVPTIGFLGVTTPPDWEPYVTAFVQRLRELGWIEGRTVAIEYRWTDGHQDRLPQIAADLARLKVNIVVTAGPAAVKAVKQAMPATPVVFALAGDPVGLGMVASLARPGGTVTGLSLMLQDTIGKRIELLEEVVPGLHHLAVMANVAFPDAQLHLNDVERLGKTLGLALIPLKIQRQEDLDPAFESLQGGAQALYVCDDPLVTVLRFRINALALAARLPTVYGLQVYVKSGGLLSYGPNVAVMFRQTAEIVDKILHGATPGDMPVEQPTKFDLFVNLKTAKTLGLTVPDKMLAVATEVIE